jgi:hypothetical protein
MKQDLAPGCECPGASNNPDRAHGAASPQGTADALSGSRVESSLPAMERMTFRSLARRGTVTRGLYCFVVLFAPAIASYFFFAIWQDYARSVAEPFRLPWLDYSPPYYASAITLLGYMLPGYRAWARVIRGGDLIPVSRFEDRPVVAFLVALCCGFACLMSILVTSVVGAALSGRAEDVGGPLGSFFVLMMMAAAIGLLVGECVLVGRDTSTHTARRIS